jgi:hypothetical protein
MKMNYRNKMIASIFPLMMVVFVILILIIYRTLCDVLEQDGKSNIKELANQYSKRMEAQFDLFFASDKTYNGVLQKFQRINVNERRKHFTDFTIELLEANDHILSF